MAPRVAVLTAASLLLSGCVKARPAAEARDGCGSCHVAHYAQAGACDDCHRGTPSAARKELAHARLLTGRAAEHVLAGGEAAREGRRLVEESACRRCHVIAGQGNRLAAELDGVVWAREQRELLASLDQPVTSMPRFGFARSQAEAVVAFLLSVRRSDAPEESYRVRFEREGGAAASAFETHCGGCHRALSPAGVHGSGNAAPNLSGLFTRFAPKTAPGGRHWSAAALADWVRNPRALRSGATMPPVGLTEAETRQVSELIRSSSEIQREMTGAIAKEVSRANRIHRRARRRARRGFRAGAEQRLRRLPPGQRRRALATAPERLGSVGSRTERRRL